MLERLKDKWSDWLLGSVIAAVGWLIAIVGKTILEPVVEDLASPQMQRALLPSLALSLVANVVLCGVVLYQRFADRMVIRFGIFWDRNLQPHCPGCKTPLHSCGWRQPGWGFDCSKCCKVVMLQEGKYNYTLEQAIEELRKKPQPTPKA